jgi:DNA-binding transcriptional regulator GbsR (MarR family)
VEENKFASKPMTAAQVAEILNYSTKHVSNKLSVIIKYKKAAKVSGYKRPAQYVFTNRFMICFQQPVFRIP